MFGLGPHELFAEHKSGDTAMMTFYKTSLCRDQMICCQCRHGGPRGVAFRKRMAKRWSMPEDFDCPLGNPIEQEQESESDHKKVKYKPCAGCGGEQTPADLQMELARKAKSK